MAVFRITSTTRVPQYAKKSIRYFAHRRNRDQETITRTIYGRHGITDKYEAYSAIDRALPGTSFFRMVISTDPIGEDTNRDLNLRLLTEQTMRIVQTRCKNQAVRYFAAIHEDHSAVRHVHILGLIKGRFSKKDLRIIREAATAQALAQRQALDNPGNQEQVRHEPQQQHLEQGQEPKGQKRPFLSGRILPLRRSRQNGNWQTGGGGSPRQNPTCLTCGPFTEMDRLTRTLFHCAGCGSIVKDQGMGLEIVRAGGAELSLGKEVGFA